MDTYRIGFDAIDWQLPLEGVRFQPFVCEGRRIRLVEYTDRFASFAQTLKRPELTEKVQDVMVRSRRDRV